MDNLTQSFGVVNPGAASAPLEGYKVVVFEETRGGSKFKMILNPGDGGLRKRFWYFFSSPKYSCYAVSSDSNLNFDFNTQLTLAAQHQSFTLKCTVYFYVSSPRLVALVFKTDPLLRIQQEIEKRMQKNVLAGKIEIEMIQNDFYRIKDEILPYTTLNQVRDFSGKFGVIIKEINMTYTVPDKFLDPNRKKEDYFLKQETAFIEEEERRKKREEEKEGKRHTHELRKIDFGHDRDRKGHENELQDLTNLQDKKNTYHDEEMKDVKSFHQFRRDMPTRLITAVDKAIETIDGAGSLERVADAALGVIKRAAYEIQEPAQSSNRKPVVTTANKMDALISGTPGPFEEIKETLLSLLAKVENSTTDPEEKKKMLACITHLLGEAHLEKKANPGTIAAYFKELTDYSVKHRKIFTRSVMEQIGELKEDIIQLTGQQEISHIPAQGQQEQ